MRVWLKLNSVWSNQMLLERTQILVVNEIDALCDIYAYEYWPDPYMISISFPIIMWCSVWLTGDLIGRKITINVAVCPITFSAPPAAVIVIEDTRFLSEPSELSGVRIEAHDWLLLNTITRHYMLSKRTTNLLCCLLIILLYCVRDGPNYHIYI